MRKTHTKQEKILISRLMALGKTGMVSAKQAREKWLEWNRQMVLAVAKKHGAGNGGIIVIDPQFFQSLRSLGLTKSHVQRVLVQLVYEDRVDLSVDRFGLMTLSLKGLEGMETAP